VSVVEHSIELGGEPVFYRSAPHGGAGAVPLYLHGVPTSSDDWLPFLARTGGIAPDLPGFGRSGKGGHLEYSAEAAARFVARFLDHVGVGSIAIVAHDFGAAAALLYADAAAVERIVLLNPWLATEPATHRLARLFRTPVIGELAMGAVTRPVLARGLRRGEQVSETGWTDARVAAIYEQFDQGTQRAILRILRRKSGAGALGQPSVKSQIIWGERDPWLLDGALQAWTEHLPGADVMRLPEAGHWPWHQQPELIERVAEFLA
jgi:pimeloyl-ACP methyl ester carboxylesterase